MAEEFPYYNLRQVAQILGISVSSIARTLKRYGIKVIDLGNVKAVKKSDIDQLAQTYTPKRQKTAVQSKPVDELANRRAKLRDAIAQIRVGKHAKSPTN